MSFIHSSVRDDETMERKLAFGMNDPNWARAMVGFASAKLYEDRVLDFFYFQDDRDGDFVTNLIAYFDNAHNKLKDDDLSPVYSATTLRGWYSMFCKFYSLVHKRDLKKDAPIIEDQISKWEKQCTVTKSKTFTKENISKQP